MAAPQPAQPPPIMTYFLADGGGGGVVLLMVVDDWRDVGVRRSGWAREAGEEGIVNASQLLQLDKMLMVVVMTAAEAIGR